jgi:hypothetical protein
VVRSERTFDGRLRLLEYVPTVLDGPPGAGATGSGPRAGRDLRPWTVVQERATVGAAGPPAGWARLC